MAVCAARELDVPGPDDACERRSVRDIGADRRICEQADGDQQHVGIDRQHDTARQLEDGAGAGVGGGVQGRVMPPAEVARIAKEALDRAMPGVAGELRRHRPKRRLGRDRRHGRPRRHASARPSRPHPRASSGWRGRVLQCGG